MGTFACFQGSEILRKQRPAAVQEPRTSIHMCLIGGAPLSLQRQLGPGEGSAFTLGSCACLRGLTGTPPCVFSGLAPSWNFTKQVLSWDDCHETFRPCEATPQAAAGLPTPSPSASGDKSETRKRASSEWPRLPGGQGQNSSPRGPAPAVPRRTITFFSPKTSSAESPLTRPVRLPPLTASPCAQALSRAGQFIGCSAPLPRPQAAAQAVRLSCRCLFTSQGLEGVWHTINASARHG